jgi:uncharacterized protein
MATVPPELGTPTFWQRSAAWFHRAMPTREGMEKSRWLRPVAHRVLAPELWRFTRRSVPRGVALGMVTGILFPIAQIPLAAIAALPLRANVPVAAVTTLISNPVTTPMLWAAAYWIGRHALRFDAVVPGDPLRDAAQSSWMQWLLSDAAPSIAVGLVIITIVMAILGYVLSLFGWRIWTSRKWRSRHSRNHN